MTERPMKNQGPKHIRTSGACKACRSRKQKCSGDRPQCVRCRINDVQCQWPQPQKRGPPKHYTAIIEKRLIETEAILLALMSQVSDEQLMSAHDHLQQDRQPSANLDEPSDAGNRHGLTRKDKFGPVYWSNYPLNSAQDSRRWWADRMSTAANEAPSRQYEVIDHALIETNVASEHGKTTLQEADTSEFRSNELSPGDESPIAPRLSVAQQDDCDATVDESSRAEPTLSIHQEVGTSQSQMTHLEQTPIRSTGYQNSRDVGGYESAYLW
ncbi:hypothetical protein B0J15DRAFT_504554 [Fusarium solani]|uniref:Zn(2)-C6 fungal-type domain-containing protein n=1 Tax=Fusarium solani TaxID=169388 RepID=A0A9P9G700_FUSSL|nr:uncharacterized protein B0J15DRAFT_504554 [Fusarium solani]KAH7234235.1 hypothetical protein B0J15DRAFT_504554 [Fusarium solani]